MIVKKLVASLVFMGAFGASMAHANTQSDDFNKGMELHVQYKYYEALAHFKQGAESGDVRSQALYSMYLEKGIQVEQDLNSARTWMEKAANSGYAHAQYSLGMMLNKDPIVAKYGVVLTPEPKESTKWLMAASMNNYPLAMLELGKHYYKGYGVKQDKKEALKWISLACMSSVADACTYKKKLANELKAGAK